MDPEQLFNENFDAIAAAKQKTGDWEKAFQLVTGQPWPKGQHIKIGDDGRSGLMQKDGPWKGIISKALPIAATVAAPFTGGASMAALLAGGAGAASSALNGGGWKGALKGGLIGAASGFGANKLGGLVKGLGGSSNVPGYGGITSPGGFGVAGGAEGALGMMGNAANGGGQSLLSKAGSGINKLLGGTSAGQPGQNEADLGSVFGGLGNAETLSRFKKGDMTQGYDALNIRASQENREREADALQNLARTSYILGGGAKPLPMKVNSGTLTALGYGPQPASDAQKQGAATLQKTMLERLTPAGQINPTKPDYLNSGRLENVGKYGGLASAGLGVAKNVFNMFGNRGN